MKKIKSIKIYNPLEGSDAKECTEINTPDLTINVPSKLKNDGNPELFTGEFWSGSTAKKLGLIDGIGNADEVLKEKFGEDVIIKKFEKPKSWINKKLSGASESQIENLINILEERSIWQKFGF